MYTIVCVSVNPFASMCLYQSCFVTVLDSVFHMDYIYKALCDVTLMLYNQCNLMGKNCAFIHCTETHEQEIIAIMAYPNIILFGYPFSYCGCYTVLFQYAGDSSGVPKSVKEGSPKGSVEEVSSEC